MENNFLKIQLSRAVWVSLIEQEKLSEAICLFEKYKNDLNNLLNGKKYLKLIQTELKYSDNIFIEKIQSLAEKYIKNKDYANALICYKYIFDNYQNNLEVLQNYIKCLDETKQYDLELSLAKILLKNNNSAENNKLISKIYDKLNDYKKAIDFYHKYIKLLGKKELDAYDNNTIGCHYFNLYIKNTHAPKDAQNALLYFQNALKFEPNSKVYLKNTIHAAMKTKNYKIEKQYWDEYINYQYATSDDEFTYSASCLRNGDIEEWKKYYNSRFRKTDPTTYPILKKPEWTGKEDISNSTLLIHYEQGYGDNFLMWGYVPRLTKIAKKVIYYIQNNAYELLKNNDWGVEVYCQRTKNLNELEFDYHLPSMSIPIALDVNKDSISVLGGYIKANPELVKKYNEQFFSTNKFKIGLAFEGVKSNNKRDIPIKNLKLLDSLDNVQFYCLSKDINDDKLKCFKRNKIINIAKNFSDFSDTAAAIENTDLIISSDNCILNLAGAMGKKTIGIYNYHYEFRWYNLSGEDCGWYKSVKPIVNNEYNNWDLSIKKAINEVNKIIKLK